MKKDGSGESYKGMPEAEFSVFKGIKVCFKRDKAQNYHSLAVQRINSQFCKSKCGSNLDLNLMFCAKESQICYPNAFDAGPKGMTVNSSKSSEM